jgi:hypothetical protein
MMLQHQQHMDSEESLLDPMPYFSRIFLLVSDSKHQLIQHQLKQK